MELQRDTSERVGEEREGEGEGGQVGVMNRGEKRGEQATNIYLFFLHWKKGS